MDGEVLPKRGLLLKEEFDEGSKVFFFRSEPFLKREIKMKM